MKFTNLEKVNEFKAFIKSITDNDKLAVIYDTDMDGISSGVLTVKALERMGITVSFQRSRTPGSRILTQDLLEVFEKKSITKIIFLDLPIETYTNTHEIKDYDVLVIDHHPRTPNYDKKIISVKSFDVQTELPGHKYCSTHLVYDLFSELTDMKEFDWILITGIIGDITFDKHKELVDSTLQKYNVKEKPNYFDTEIGELIQYTTYATCIGTQEEMNKIFNALYFAKNHKDAISKLEHLNPVKEEFEKLVLEFENNKEEIGDDLVFYEFEAEYYINSPVCTALSQTKVPDKSLLCIHFKDGRANISARRQDGKVHMGELLRDCVKDLKDSNGGGHPVAAGAKVNTDDYETFKKRVILWVKEHE